jgi:hypothetical protein
MKRKVRAVMVTSVAKMPAFPISPRSLTCREQSSIKAVLI